MNAIQMKRKCNNVIAKYDPKYSECGSVDIKRIKIHANASINLGTETQAVRCCQNEVEDSKSISNQNGLVCRQRISSTAIQDIFKKHKVAMEFYQVAISKFESISDDLRALPDIFHKQTVAMEFSGVSLLKFQSVSDDLINIIEENERCDALQQHPNSNKVKSYQEQNLTMKTKIIYDQNSSSNFEVIDLDSDEEDCKWISFGNNAELITNSRDLLESPDISTSATNEKQNGKKDENVEIIEVIDESDEYNHTPDHANKYEDAEVIDIIDESDEDNHTSDHANKDEDAEVIEIIDESDEDNHTQDHANKDVLDHQRGHQKVRQTNDMEHHKKKDQCSNIKLYWKENKRQIKYKGKTLEKLKQEYFRQINLNKIYYKKQLTKLYQRNYKEMERDVNNNSVVNQNHHKNEQENNSERKRVTKRKRLTMIMSKNNLKKRLKTKPNMVSSRYRDNKHITRRVNKQESSSFCTDIDSRLKSSCENYKDLQKKEGNRSLNITWLPCPLCLCSPVEHKNLVNRCGLKKIEDQRFPITPLVPKVTSEKRIYVQNSSITHTDDSQQISKSVKGQSILSTDNSQIVEDGPSLKKYSRKVKIIVPTVKKMIEDLPSNSRRSNNY